MMLNREMGMHANNEQGSAVAVNNAAATHLTQGWGKTLQGAVCECCDWTFLIESANRPVRCPHCWQANLTLLPDEQVNELPYIRPPEAVLPYQVSEGSLTVRMQDFARGIPFAPEDLTSQNLKARLRQVYLPMWLVDAEVKATWQAEVGFNYQVVSHQEHYDDLRGGWSTHQVEEERVRWEARQGRLARVYQNISAPALDEHAAMQRALGDFTLSQATPYQPGALSNHLVRLPNRTPQAAWSEAAPAFQAAAAEECRQASNADHIRQFRWQPEYSGQNWTLLLLPLYATYYLDDAQLAQPVLVNGQTGQVNGARRASMKRAQRAALIICIIAVVLFLFSVLIGAVGIAVPPLLLLGGIGVCAAVLLGLAAVIPIVMAWQFNKRT